MESEKLQLFEDQQIRSVWDAENEEWLFSVTDVVRVLTEQPDARRASTYWAVLKNECLRKVPINCLQLVSS